MVDDLILDVIMIALLLGLLMCGLVLPAVLAQPRAAKSSSKVNWLEQVCREVSQDVDRD